MKYFNIYVAMSPGILSDVRHVSPPNLGEDCILKKVVCHRPLRKESPKLTVTTENGRIYAGVKQKHYIILI